jgi:hypothetical protein
MLNVPHICAGLIYGFYSSLPLDCGAGLAHLALKTAFSNDSSDFFKGASGHWSCCKIRYEPQEWKGEIASALLFAGECVVAVLFGSLDSDANPTPNSGTAIGPFPSTTVSDEQLIWFSSSFFPSITYMDKPSKRLLRNTLNLTAPKLPQDLEQDGTLFELPVDLSIAASRLVCERSAEKIDFLSWLGYRTV